jgi:hypothetical protein
VNPPPRLPAHRRLHEPYLSRCRAPRRS